jgi:hypothetical protein
MGVSAPFHFRRTGPSFGSGFRNVTRRAIGTASWIARINGPRGIVREPEMAAVRLEAGAGRLAFPRAAYFSM